MDDSQDAPSEEPLVPLAQQKLQFLAGCQSVFSAESADFGLSLAGQPLQPHESHPDASHPTLHGFGADQYRKLPLLSSNSLSLQSCICHSTHMQL